MPSADLEILFNYVPTEDSDERITEAFRLLLGNDE